VSVIDGGRAHGAVALRSGARVVVGRSPEADIRISDPRASRRHLEISVDGWGYRLTDLGSTNPARIIAGGRPGQMHPGSQVTLPSGQVAIGESVITLYPFDDGYR
jgi:pSer/pThr/pTyr-binding forkhead associated (FHA) protein